MEAELRDSNDELVATASSTAALRGQKRLTASRDSEARSSGV